MMHWAAKYIGLRYVEGGRGPDAFDCWGLLRCVYAAEFGIELPALPGIGAASAFSKHAAFSMHGVDWKRLDRPVDGCGVAMSQKAVYHHVGVFVAVDGGKILHCWEGHGSAVADSLRGIAMKGFRSVAFYQHQSYGIHHRDTESVRAPHGLAEA